MPSGAKKRKSAKKKMENQSKNQLQLNPPSSASSTQFHEREEENIVVEEESVVQVEREIKINGKSNKEDGKIEHDELATKSSDGGLLEFCDCGCCDGPDDESNGVENSPARADPAPVFDSVTEDDSLTGPTLLEYLSKFAPEGMSLEDIPAIENIFFFREKALASMINRSENYVTSYDYVSKQNEEFEVTVKHSAPFVDLENGKIIQSHDKSALVFVPMECVTSESDDRSERKKCASSESAERLEQKECVSSESGDRFETKACISSETGDRLSSESDDRSELKKCVASESDDRLELKECVSLESGPRPERKECAYSENDDRLEPKCVSSENDDRSEAKECVSSESDDRLTLSDYLRLNDNGAEHDKDFGVNQTSPRPMKATSSWKSCCGLFEFFEGSGR